MAAVPKSAAAEPERCETRPKLPAHSLPGLAPTQQEADQPDAGLPRRQDQEIGEDTVARTIETPEQYFARVSQRPDVDEILRRLAKA